MRMQHKQQQQTTNHKCQPPPQSCRGEGATCMCHEHITKRQNNIVPGHKTYSQAVNQIKTTTIVSDSMCRSIRVRDFNNMLDRNTEKILINKYPAAHAKQILHYSNYTLMNDKPDNLIIMAGSNDVSYDSKDGNTADPEAIATRIIEIGTNARRHGVSRVFINSIINREGYFYNRIIKKLNLILRLKCNTEQFYFIDNSNISLTDLSDGLHLNSNGNNIFIHNLLNCCESYNPYFLEDDYNQ